MNIAKSLLHTLLLILGISLISIGQNENSFLMMGIGGFIMGYIGSVLFSK